MTEPNTSLPADPPATLHPEPPDPPPDPFGFTLEAHGNGVRLSASLGTERLIASVIADRGALGRLSETAVQACALMKAGYEATAASLDPPEPPDGPTSAGDAGVEPTRLGAIERGDIARAKYEHENVGAPPWEQARASFQTACMVEVDRFLAALQCAGFNVVRVCPPDTDHAKPYTP